MQRIQLICTGKLKESFYIDACEEYAKRLSRYCALERTELPESGDVERDGEAVGAAIHELVHVMQAYWTKDATNDNCPEWLSEGIADYVRWFMFEPQSGGCDYLKDAGTRATIHYNDSYRETASFLDYVEKEHPGTVKKANALMRKAKFNDRVFWKEATGKTAAELEAGWKRSQ